MNKNCASNGRPIHGTRRRAGMRRLGVLTALRAIQGRGGFVLTGVRTKSAIWVFSILAVLAGACGGQDDEPTVGGAGGGQGGKAANTVEMKLIAFKPERLTVTAGTIVTWAQRDAGFHTVTSGRVEQGSSAVTEKPDGRFDSGQLATDKTFTFSFDQPGTYPYYCAVHPATMQAEITVS